MPRAVGIPRAVSPLVTRAAWRADRPTRCEVCGGRGRLEAHHVIRDQVVRREHGDTYDPRNRLMTCPRCHPDGAQGGRRLPIEHVPDRAIEFAVELLGPGKAYNELVRWHPGAETAERIVALLGLP